MSSPNSLSRELLRWCQSLDLAYSIKNIKRDFSNGFLIAEIFSRYFDKTVQMHGFDNGTAVRVKKDNWAQLVKFFKKHGLEHIASSDEVTGVIHCEDGVVVEVIKRMYVTLTMREVQVVVRKPRVEREPAYMKNTGSTVVKEKLRTGLLETTDELTTTSVLTNHLTNHESTLHASRLNSSLSLSSTNNRSCNGAPTGNRRIEEREREGPVVTVEEIVVRQSDKNIAAIRARRDNNHRNGAGSPSGMSMLRNSPSLSPSQGGGGRASPDGGDSVVMFSNGSIGNNSNNSNNSNSRYNNQQQQQQQQTMTSLFDSLVTPHFTSFKSFTSSLLSSTSTSNSNSTALDISDSVSSSLCDESNQIAYICSSDNREFEVMSSLFLTLLVDLDEPSASFKSVCNAMASVGVELTNSDGNGGDSAVELFGEYSLPSVCAIIKSQPLKRSSVLQVYYSYVSSPVSSHISAIKRLQTCLDDLPSFISSLTSLAFIEPYPTFDSQLLDLYLYYSILGMGQPNPSLRSGSVAMLSVVFANGGVGEVGQFLDQLLALSSEDTFWETRAQLLVVASTVLSRIGDNEGEGRESEENENVIDKMCQIISTIFSTSSHSNVKRVGVAYLAPILRIRPAQLFPLFLQVLLSLRSSDLDILLSINERSGGVTTMELPVGGASGLRYHLNSIVFDVDHLDLARVVVDGIGGGGGNGNGMSYGQAQVLLGSVIGVEPLGLNSDEWCTFWDVNSSLIFDGFSDENVCHLCVDIIMKFIENSVVVRTSIIEEDVLTRLLNAVYNQPHTQHAQQEGITDLLTRFADLPSVRCVRYVCEVLEGSAVVEGRCELENLMANLKM